MLVVFRADASPSIGGGHVMRCLALADELRNRGAQCCFACASQSGESVPALRNSGHGYVELALPNDSKALSMVSSDGCDWLVVDHYGWDAVQETRCRPWAKNILVIDDLADRPHDCELLLDQTFGRLPSTYSGLIPLKCETLVGSQYALLRPEFAARRGASIARRARGQLESIFVSMGLTDPANSTETVLRGISESKLSFAVRVVMGPSAPGLQVVRSLVDRSGGNFKLSVGSERMAELMMAADLAFGAAGSTAWERCCLGLPSVMIQTADNQESIAKGLHSAGAAISIGKADEVGSVDVARILESLRLNPHRMRELSQNAAAICDGLGASRVAEAMVCEL